LQAREPGKVITTVIFGYGTKLARNCNASNPQPTHETIKQTPSSHA
jgi:hypothetical protein